jgi:serine/threonine-protein kinase HipA
MRRLAFMVLSGNADAHLKNWSLLYPDGVRPRLAPVYDLVSTVMYSLDTHTALRWWAPPAPTAEPPKQLAQVDLADLMVVASYAMDDAAWVMEDLEAFVREARGAWPEIAATAPQVVRDRVTAHLAASSL